MRVFFIRHGQSEGNVNGYHNSWLPVPLTEKGREDAAMAGRLIKNVPFDKVYSSDLLRAIQTQQIALPDAEVERLPVLREINVGNLLGRKVTDCYEEYGEIYFVRRDATDYSAYGGESYEDLSNRIRQFLSMMEESEYENVAVFGHGTYMQIALDLVSGVRQGKSRFTCQNGSVAVFRYEKGSWRVDAWDCTELK